MTTTNTTNAETHLFATQTLRRCALLLALGRETRPANLTVSPLGSIARRFSLSLWERAGVRGIFETRFTNPNTLTRRFALLLALAVTAAATTAWAEPKTDAKPDHKLIGTWKLLSAKYGGQDYTLPEGSTTLKHVTPSQFMWASYDKDGLITRAAGGFYTLKGDDYEETPEYGLGSDFDAIKGKAQTFKWKVEGNKWYHTGKLSSGLTIDEVWERVDRK